MPDLSRRGPIAGTEVVVTSGSVISVYIINSTGDQEVTIDVSPDDGTSWVPVQKAIIGDGVLTVTVAATRVRASVHKAAALSSGDIAIVVR